MYSINTQDDPIRIVREPETKCVIDNANLYAQKTYPPMKTIVRGG
jgi:hypothetical protein